MIDNTSINLNSLSHAKPRSRKERTMPISVYKLKGVSQEKTVFLPFLLPLRLKRALRAGVR